jgi:hypothetical protein
MYGVTLDGDRNVYACDFGNASIARISASGEISTYSTDARAAGPRSELRGVRRRGQPLCHRLGDVDEDDGIVFRISPDGATDVWSEGVPRFPTVAA